MSFSVALLLQPLLVLGALTSGCGGSGESAQRSATPDDASNSSHIDGASPSCSAECRAERRAEREAREAERCGELLSRVRLTFRITATPVAAGSAIGLRRILVNRSEATLFVSTGGMLKVLPGPRSNRISWGGSSADGVFQKPGTTSRGDVWHDRQPPGWHPIGDRVTSFDFYAHTDAPGPGSVACGIPATIVAPPGLVERHPSGRWTQEPSP